LMLDRAASAGDADAALALADTYDPAVLSRAGVVGVAADPALAAQWRKRAEQLGGGSAAAAEKQRQAALAADQQRQAALAEQQRQAAAAAEQQRQAAAAAAAEQQRQAATAAEQQRQTALAAEQQRQATAAEQQRLAAAAAEQQRQTAATAEQQRQAAAVAEQQRQAAAATKPAISPDAQRFLVRGRQLLTTGDIDAARSFFERASATGAADATFELAGTYDPNVLRELGVIGIAADPAKAVAIYRQAQKQGASGVPERLQRLGQ
jgi:hypothetical protein